ncbi:hypothetical protein BpHYR1_052361 [Brachionus plicatilis]|uniref:Transmembrane protein n=1 Tax=Brachionus plicatilis TaxID=10195 RepID=A0A3M7T1B8_BRAPC|nr:hypothetical protein BpHYR1_052361 [Brachionus plicatilis]
MLKILNIKSGILIFGHFIPFYLTYSFHQNYNNILNLNFNQKFKHIQNFCFHIFFQHILKNKYIHIPKHQFYKYHEHMDWKNSSLAWFHIYNQMVLMVHMLHFYKENQNTRQFYFCIMVQ